MKKAVLLSVLFLSQINLVLVAQHYKYQEAFDGANLDLDGNTYSYNYSTCTASYFSTGTFYQNGDTLFMTSLKEFDDRELRVRGKWLEEADSIRVKIITYLRDGLANADLNQTIISLVGTDSIAIKLTGSNNISLPLSFLPINEIYFDQKRASLFFPANQFNLYYDFAYERHFVRMEKEPFRIINGVIYPDSQKWGYVGLEKTK